MQLAGSEAVLRFSLATQYTCVCVCCTYIHMVYVCHFTHRTTLFPLSRFPFVNSGNDVNVVAAGGTNWRQHLQLSQCLAHTSTHIMQGLTFIWVTAVMGNGLGTDFRTADTALWGQSTGGNGGGSVTPRERMQRKQTLDSTGTASPPASRGVTGLKL